ncbi:MAG: hypothetical protein RJQ01_00810 [Microcella sp.]|uniref:hypothetical protein n=1 Tax=Microcella sp. TaxID=1913979 RepID=UPI003315003C
MALNEKLAPDLPDGFEWGAADEALIEQGDGLLETIAALEEAIERDGVTVTGSSGQSRLNSAITELRQARLGVARIVALLSVQIDRAVSSSGQVRRGTRYSPRDVRRR